jgi:hypothetical protein
MEDRARKTIKRLSRVPRPEDKRALEDQDLAVPAEDLEVAVDAVESRLSFSVSSMRMAMVG